MKNLVEYMSVLRDGDLWVVVETGMPEQCVRVGVGDTLREAYDSMQATPVQSTGRDSGRGAALRWAAAAGWIATADIDEVDDACLTDDDSEEGVA